jgi:hypothetical protein
MFKWLSLCLAVVVVILGYLLWANNQLAESTRRKQEAEQEREKTAAVAARERSKRNAAAVVAVAFLSTLVHKDGNQQLGLTTDAFQARHKKTGGILRLNPPDAEAWLVFHRIIDETSDYRWRGSSDGELVYEGDFRMAEAKDGKYVIVLARDEATGGWRVDSFTYPE